jgi:capsular polysaccharide biosynthesis protein
MSCGGWMTHNPMTLFSFFKRKPTVNAVPSLSSLSVDDTDMAGEVRDRLGAGDIADAWAMLSKRLPTTDDPHLLALAVHLCILRGKTDEAGVWSQKAEKVAPHHLDVLRSQAMLAQYLGQFEMEYQTRLKRIIQIGVPPVPELTAALSALINRGETRGRIPQRDVDRLLALFTVGEQLATTIHTNAFAEQLFRLSDYATKAVEIWRQRNPGNQVAQFKWASDTFLAQHHPSRFTCTFDPSDPLLKVGHFVRASIWTGYANNPSLNDLGLMVQGYQTTRQRTQSEDASSQLVMHSLKTCLIQSDTSTTQVDEPSLLIGSSPNYYHFLIEHVGRLAVMHELDVPSEGRLCWINSELLPFQVEMLELAGIDKTQIRTLPPPGHTVHFDNLCAPFPPTKGGHRTSASIARWARNVLVPRARSATENATHLQTGHRRLYLSRHRTARRRIHNEAIEIWPWLAKHGFEFIEPEGLSVREQLLLFSEAEWIVGGSGAAITNMIFAPAGAKVVIALNQHFTPEAQQQFFPPLAKACGHHISVVPCAPVVVNSSRAMDADVYLAGADLIQALSALNFPDI